ncbi:MAG: DUF2971 domain-containing protein [Candidatus Delongbacteria bacterium]
MKLFKYMEFYGFFENFMLRFTQPNDLNDTRECRPIMNITDPERFLAEQEIRLCGRYRDQLRSMYPNQSPQEIELAIVRALEIQREDYRINLPAKLDKFRNIFLRNVNSYVGILSLTSKDNDLKMWYDYGGKNKGFRIEFSEDSLFLKKSIKDNPMCGEVLPVQYDDNRPTVNVYPGSLDLPRELFWWKTLEWKTESEYRIVRNLLSADKVESDRYYLWRLSPGDLKSVVFGYLVDETKIAELKIKIRCFDKNVEIKRITVDGSGDFMLSEVG